MEDIVIREASLSDAAELSQIYAYYVNNTAITFEDEAPTEKEFAERMKGIMAFYPYLVAEFNGEAVGYCYAGTLKNRSAYDWAVETTVYVKPGFARKGTGAALYAALEERLKNHGIKNMYACIASPAQGEDEYLGYGSINFHKKSGFTLCGTFRLCGNKFGRWYDMVWMEKMISDHNANPPRPVPYGSLKHD